MITFLNIGAINEDWIKHSEGDVKEEEKTATNVTRESFDGPDIEKTLGGSGVNTVAGVLKYSGKDIGGVFGAIGTDDVGKRLYDALNEKNVEFLGFQKEGESGVGFIIKNKEGKRGIDVSPGVNDSLTKDDFEEVMFNKIIQETPEYTILTTFACYDNNHDSLETQIYATEWLKDEGSKIVFAPGEYYTKNIFKQKPDHIMQLLRYTDILSLNESEIIDLAGRVLFEKFDNYNDAAKHIGAAFRMEIVTVTLGERGAYAVTPTNQVYEPGMEVEIEDATGAGDSYLAGFLTAHKEGSSLEDCVRIGIANSAHKMKYEGGCDYPPSEEVIRMIKKVSKVK